MNDYLADARDWFPVVARTSDLDSRISMLNLICKTIVTHLELFESSKPVTDHLIGARKSVTAASLASDASGTIAWLTDACGQILNHLESPQGDKKLSRGENNEQSAPVWNPRLQKLLDGEPYIVRNEAGIVWAPIAYATLCPHGELVAMWVEDADH